MGGGAYSTNNRVNAAVAAKANARQPVEEVVSLNADPFPPTVSLNADPFPSTVSTLNAYKGIPDLDFGVGTQYDSFEEALGGYGDYFSNIQDQRKSAAKVVNYNQYDPSDFVRERKGGSPHAVIGRAFGKS